MIRTKIPMRLVSVANRRDHWAVSAERTANHRMAARLMVRGLVPRDWDLTGTFRIALTRIAPRRLDKEDNLGMALKAAKDGVADALGFKDDADKRLVWELGQETGKPHEYAVRIEVERTDGADGTRRQGRLAEEAGTRRRPPK